MPDDSSPFSSDADRVIISVNPKAGARSSKARVDRLARLLGDAGFRTEQFTKLDEMADRAKELFAVGRLRALVGAGGDGTAAELVNRTPPGLPITMFPAGNENLLARYLRLGDSPEQVCRTIARGRVLQLDAGKAGQRIFLLMIGCGFDAEVVRRLHENRTGHAGNLAYCKPILRSIRSYEYPRLRVYWDADESQAVEEPEFPTEARWLFAFNLPCYGGGLRLAPRAKGTDGLLDVCTFLRGSLWHGLRYAAAVLAGLHPRLADCTVGRVRKLTITSEAEVPYQLDGDPGGMLPVEIEVLPKRLTLIVPGDRADELTT